MKYWFVKLFIFFSFCGFSQRPDYLIDKPDFEKIHQEDLINDQDKTKPYRFGISYSTEIDLTKNPLQEPNFITREFIIHAKGALSLNFLFEQVYLSEHASLTIRSADGKRILGPYTQFYNNKSGKLATGVLPDSVAIIELREPVSPAFESSLMLSQITYGYRSLLKSYGLGDSGPCHVNTICPEGDDWRDQIRSVVMTLQGGNTLCSGALINNTCSDGKPYYLTANHCLTGNEDSWAFLFNWESPSCSLNLDGAINNTLSGAEVRANSSTSDFALLELFSSPPDSYNPYYSGWDVSGNIPANETTIHHPAGDVKKISKDDDPASINGNYWRVADWDFGTTEGGSSGAPLFDHHHRIIGQLQGGLAACWNNDFDEFGRLDVSWDAVSGDQNQLQPWLDGCNTGEVNIDGFDPFNFTPDSNDIALIDIVNVDSVLCSHSLEPTLVLKNTGLDTIFSCIIQYDVNGVFYGLTWNGVLAPYGIDSVTLPALVLTLTGVHTLSVDLVTPNGLQDGHLMNNHQEFTFYHIADPVPVYLTLRTDGWGSETTWTVKDDQSRLFGNGGPYADVAAGQMKRDTFCLQRDSCYVFTINDTYGDGISDDDGYYLIQNVDHDTLAYILQENFGFQEVQSFCVEDTTTIDVEDVRSLDLGVHVFPNPSNGQVFVNVLKSEHYTIHITDLLGRLLMKKEVNYGLNSITTNLSNGEYIISVYQGAHCVKRMPWIVIR